MSCSGLPGRLTDTARLYLNSKPKTPLISMEGRANPYIYRVNDD